MTRSIDHGAFHRPTLRTNGLRIGMIGTYPPTQCGIATFTAALGDGLQGTTSDEVETGIVRLVDGSGPGPRPEILTDLVRGCPDSMRQALAALNRLDVAIVQHEYGIYGGVDGSDVVDLVRAIRPPTIVVLHTVLDRPSASQRRILEALGGAADALVTMTGTARRRLRAYDVDMNKVSVIPHGAHPAAELGRTEVADRPTILTWGLIGPGKGIEWAIEALALLRDLNPAPRYLVVGQTHPNVLERDGEAYRDSLQARARELGVAHLVEFHVRYSDRGHLQRTIAAADVVLLPYDNTDQVTSGVLVEAVAAGQAVVSTSFPHAVEVLGSGVGLIVPRCDPTAIAEAIRRTLTEPGLHEQMVTSAAALAPHLSWTSVARQYAELATNLLHRRDNAVA